MHPGGKYIFQQMGSAGPHCQDHPAVVDRILDPGRLVTIVAGLEFTGFLDQAPFAAESTGEAFSPI